MKVFSTAKGQGTEHVFRAKSHPMVVLRGLRTA